MSDKPILMSAPMIRALLDGSKTQTRRLLYAPRKMKADGALPKSRYYPDFPAPSGGLTQIYTLSGASNIAVGDRLWVKETWRTSKFADELKPSQLMGRGYSRLWYEADGRDNCDQHGKIRVSIHMPRWASRLTLTVTGVRVERLQDISEADAEAEGVERVDYHGEQAWKSYETYPDGSRHPHSSVPNRLASISYRELWNSINGPDAWEQNPWVVALTFTVKQRNIYNA